MSTSVPSVAGTPNTPNTGALSACLDAAVASGLPGVVAAITRHGDTVFEGASGVRTAGTDEPMSVDTVLSIFSMTKAVTGAAAMQLVERGLLSLDDPAGRILPDLADPVVLDGFGPDGAPRTRPARTPLTLRHLLTHTSGYVYDMWNGEFATYLSNTNTPSFGTLTKAALRVPLMFDPGTRWEYGIGIDWVGLMVEQASGTTLGAYCAEHLFQPLGMTNTAFTPTPQMTERHASLHLTTPDGPVPFAMPAPAAPEFEMGGGGLHSTVHDYLRFANMILRKGELADGTRVLEESTVEQMRINNMGPVSVVPLPTANPMLTCAMDLFPGTDAKWGLSFIINTEPTPQGRPANSLAWAGLANSFYWIDPLNSVCGVWATQLFPFLTPPAIDGFRAFEAAYYASL